MEENKTLTPPQEKAALSFEHEGENQLPEAQKQVTIPVKFNKETKNLTAGEAQILAQKGMKFEMIENDFDKLRTLASRQKMSVGEFISDLERRQNQKRREELIAECGGNEEIADRVLQFENGEKADDGLSELKEYFPTVKSLDDLPRAVVESARLKGENLLNTYLKYRLIKRKQAAEKSLFEQGAANASVGSLKSAGVPAEDDFIKALWGK